MDFMSTKSERGLDEWNRQSQEQRAKSERASKVATLARRPHGSPAEPGTIPIRVRAVERKGHDGMFRAGQFWPSQFDGRTCMASARLLACLRLEANLHVETLSPEEVPPGLEHLDIPEQDAPPSLPENLAPNPLAQENAQLRAEVLKADNERLRAELAGLRAPKK